jgi:hypothetical protein
MPLRVTNCNVSNNSITITFSDPVVTGGPGPVAPDSTSTSAANPANYSIFDPGSVDFSQPQNLQDAAIGTFSTDASGRFISIALAPTIGGTTTEFQNGDWVHVTVSGVQSISGDSLDGGQVSLARQVPGGNSQAKRVTRDVEDAVTYPILTEQVRFPRSGGGPTAGPSSWQNGAPLGQTAALAIGDVLGWKVSGTDPKGFVGALTQAFTLTDVEGHVESTWNPRTYAVQTDLGGGISGAQASLYTRAKDALDQSLALLDGLYPLDPDADPEYVKALREMGRSQMTEIVREFGAVGLPSILRIDTYFEILLGQHPTRHSNPVQFDPDKVGGTLGQLRDTYGIYFRGNPFNNSIEDEQDITNFRVISDYMTSLLQSWISNREFFIVSPHRIAFFGTQLVLISRQLNVIAETVDEVRFTLDSVFIGPNERQTLLLKFADHALPPMFLEDVLVEIERFVEDEGPRLLRDGGKISVTNNILPVVKTLKHMIHQAHDPENRRELPDGFKTARVRHSLDDLHDQLGELIKLTKQVEQQVPFPEDDLRIDGILASVFEDYKTQSGYSVTISFFGNGIDPRARVTLHSEAFPPSGYQVEFYSAERIDVTFDPGATASSETEEHEVKITNPDGESATGHFTYYWDANGNVTVAPIKDSYDDYGNNGYVDNSDYRLGTAVAAQTARPRSSAPSGVSRAVAATQTSPSSTAARPFSTPVSSAPPTPPPPPLVPAATVDHIAALQKQMDDLKTDHKQQMDDLKADHKNLFERFESKIVGFFEKKQK